MIERPVEFPPATVLRELTCDLAQVAAVRRIALDDGAGRGARILAFSTGGGLDFWVAAERTLDIATLSFHGVQIGWQSPAGLGPLPVIAATDSGFGFDRAFGGFLVTCGLDHIRQPAGGHPLHGKLPFTPALLRSYGEDWAAPQPLLYCEGEVVQWHNGAEAWRLKRRIEAPIGGNAVRLIDRVENIGPTPLPLHLLYHVNVGWPAIAPGAQVKLDGATLLGPMAMPVEKGPMPAILHRLGHEGEAECLLEAGPMRLRLGWQASALPFLQLWCDLRPRRGVFSIEPCNVGRREDGSNADAPLVEPGQSTEFVVSIAVEKNGNNNRE